MVLGTETNETKPGKSCVVAGTHSPQRVRLVAGGGVACQEAVSAVDKKGAISPILN